MARILFFLPLLVFCTTLAAQQPRYALVIGNGNYEFASLGQTPANDANAMRDALTLAGFKVDFYTNLGYFELTAAMRGFSEKIKDSEGAALFYYSGHGVQLENANYLVPIGAKFTTADDIKEMCVPVSRIAARMMNAGTSPNILLLDACRSFPIPSEVKSASQGLAKENFSVPELLVAYATAPGSTATLRGEGGLSLFTSQLLKHIKTPGLLLETVLKNTRRDVLAKSNNQQRPDETGNLTSDFYFFAPVQKPATQDREQVVPKNETQINKKTDTESQHGVDSDLDGTPDATDPCPNDYGTLAAGGCPDYDEDGVPNQSDKCPNEAGKKAWQGCPDSDGDGIPDHEDECPTESGTASDKGCPPSDRDRDGVTDAADACPDHYGLKTLSGCPDSDNDGVADKSDKCPNTAGLTRYQGCPDTDGDGIPDHEDTCPNVKGSAAAKGCPDLSQLGFRPDDFVRVVGGKFQMGSDDGSADEKPIHSVTVPTFDIGKYEVTVAQFRAYIEDSKQQTDADKEGWSYVWTGSTYEKKNGVNWRCDVSGKPRPESEYNHPVIHISWNDATAYCEWLSQKTGQTYRLPTEAEWEYAAKGGIKGGGFKYAGSNTIDDVAWYSTNSGSKTHPVGQKNANEIGLFDMSGNVWEWCSDWYGEKYYEEFRASTANNPKGPTTGEYAVLRGGSWYNLVNLCRASLRYWYTRSVRLNNVGLRVARAVEGR